MIAPIYNRVIVRELELSDLNKEGGLEIPAETENTPRYGEVISVGAECKYCHSGDKLIWRQGAGDIIFVDNEELIIMNEPDVIAITEMAPRNYKNGVVIQLNGTDQIMHCPPDTILQFVFPEYGEGEKQGGLYATEMSVADLHQLFQAWLDSSNKVRITDK